MAYVPGYEHDIFVSYAHVDDKPMGGGSRWVTTLIKDHFEVRLNQRLGREHLFDLWMDHDLNNGQPVTPQILERVRRTAILVAVLSPGYVASQWCDKERDAFLAVVRERGGRRVFVVERDQIDDRDRPGALSDIKPYQFWLAKKPGRAPVILGTPQAADDPEYHSLVEDMVRAVEGELRALSNGGRKPLVPVPGIVREDVSVLLHAGEPEPPAFEVLAKTVLLAEVTDDLELERNGLRRFLEQQNVRVLPPQRTWYSQEPAAFRQAFRRDIAAADLFVQLLSGIAGRRPADMPHGYARFQQELAIAAKKPILQWRAPALKLEDVDDEDHRALLDGARAEPMEDFRAEVHRRLFEPQLPLCSEPNEAYILVDADVADRKMADEMVSVLGREGVDAAHSQFSADPAKNRLWRKQQLAQCTALIIVYGKAEAEWVSMKLSEARQGFRKRRKTPLAVCALPPEPKEQLPIQLANMRYLDCRGGLDEAQVLSFVRSAIANGTDAR